jgi:lysophospholipase L1-like esterase
MNGRQARGCGMKAHDKTNTTTKNAANSIVGKLTAGILATAAVAALLPAPAVGASVLVVGDSLEVGSAPHLRTALAGTAVDIDARAGRTSSEGVRVLSRRLRPEHEVVVFPLGTNDLNADVFAANLGAVEQLAGGRCLVLATIARPPLRGAPASALNRVIAAHGSAQVADWRPAAASPGVLGRDRVHATGEGYALRGSLLAETVQGCLAGGAASGIPAPEDPNVRVPLRERRRPERPEPRPRPARLPARAALLGLGSAVLRAVRPVAAALRDARTAATTAAPEPVLGAP